MKINWKVRLKNKFFWLTAIPTALLVIQAIASIFGYTLDLSELGDKLINLVNAIFALLAALGVVIDHTTSGVGDSKQALMYDNPRKER